MLPNNSNLWFFYNILQHKNLLQSSEFSQNYHPSCHYWRSISSCHYCVQFVVNLILFPSRPISQVFVIRWGHQLQRLSTGNCTPEHSTLATTVGQCDPSKSLKFWFFLNNLVLLQMFQIKLHNAIFELIL